jgi:arylsulfatase A-like enzyme
VYLMDLFPTFAGFGGAKLPDGVEGKDLRPIIEGKQSKVRDVLYTAYRNCQRAVRDDRWKLIAYPKIGYLQLFDLKTDPYEKTNLIDRPESAPHTARLLALMKEWQAKVGDTCQVPTVSRQPEKVDLTGQPRKPDQWQPDWIVKKYFEAPAAAPR